MVSNIIKKIAGYSDEYVKENLDWYDKNGLLTNWQKGLNFLFDHSFYQGRSDIISDKVRIEAINVLENFIKENDNNAEAIFEKENFPKIESRLKEVIGKGKIGRGMDVKMVISILEFVSKIDGKNVVNYSISRTRNGELKNHFWELQNIRSIGPKCSSLYLRDLISVYSLEADLHEEDLICLQPIDTWVRQVAYEGGIIDNKKSSDETVRKNIVKACKESNVSTIKFNQGAWYMGYNSFKLLIERLKDE